MSGHARLTVFNSQGQRLCDAVMSKLTLHIGRQDNDAAMDLSDSNQDVQILKLPQELTGVSRLHASISWSEKDMAFKIEITGRNGATINHIKVNQTDSSILSAKHFSTLALGKSCFIYFCPSISNKKHPFLLASPRGADEATSARKLAGMRWQPAALDEFRRRDTQTMQLNELLTYLSNTYTSHCESSVSWRKTVKQVIRKPPFSFDESTQIVTLS